MTEGMKRIMRELDGLNKEVVVQTLLNENQKARDDKKLRLSSDINNLVFIISNPEVKPGGVKPEDLITYKEFYDSLS
jgi:hypothetical protein